MANTFSIVGAHGEVEVDCETRKVVAVLDDCHCNYCAAGPKYADLTYDVKEWQEAHPNEVLAGNTIDILDIGTTDTAGGYCPANPEYRRGEYAA